LLLLYFEGRSKKRESFLIQKNLLILQEIQAIYSIYLCKNSIIRKANFDFQMNQEDEAFMKRNIETIRNIPEVIQNAAHNHSPAL
jgi:hypothetical protein